MIRKLILQNRSCRRFDERSCIERSTLCELVDLARLSPSAGNIQPLKFILSCAPQTNSVVFPCLTWAAYLKDWNGPPKGERPAAYIIILLDTSISASAGCDHGIAAQSIMLGAVERGLAGCMIGSIDRPKLRKAMRIPKHYEILLVLAIGKPGEKVILEQSDGKNIKYWRDKDGMHHVPKRKLDAIILA